MPEAARCVEQDRVEGPAVPPLRHLAGVRRACVYSLTGQAQALQGLVDTLQPLRVGIQGQHLELRSAFEQMGRLASGGSAGVQNACIRRQPAAHQQPRRALGGQILYRGLALREAGQALDRARPGQDHRLVQIRRGRSMGRQAGGGQALQVIDP